MPGPNKVSNKDRKIAQYKCDKTFPKQSSDNSHLKQVHFGKGYEKNKVSAPFVNKEPVKIVNNSDLDMRIEN